LAEKSNGILSQANLSKIEQGLKEPSEEIIGEIAKATQYPVEFFFEGYNPFPSHSVYHRKRKMISRSLIAKIDAITNIKIFHLRKLLMYVDVPEDSFPRIDPDQSVHPSVVAQSARQHFKCPKGSIRSVVEIIERAGGIIIPSDFNTQKMDGFTMCIDNSPPVIFINKDLTGDRWRYTLTHEMAHIIMHLHRFVQDEDTADREANEFASEFLMPEEDIRHMPVGINLYKLADLKKYWKVSMAALLKRAENLKMISPRMGRHHWMNLSRQGYKMREPPETDIPVETPHTFEQLLKIYKEELGYTANEFAKIFQ
jgi:Zn-dependent peptidase ImmA (M78 family)